MSGVLVGTIIRKAIGRTVETGTRGICTVRTGTTPVGDVMRTGVRIAIAGRAAIRGLYLSGKTWMVVFGMNSGAGVTSGV